MKDLVHIQRRLNHLLILSEVILQISERGEEHRLQQNLVAT